MSEPCLPLTVDYALWRAVAASSSREFADSYLSGAVQHGKYITARTTIGFDRLKAHGAVMSAIEDYGLTLLKPLPVGHPDRLDTF